MSDEGKGCIIIIVFLLLILLIGGLVFQLLFPILIPPEVQEVFKVVYLPIFSVLATYFWSAMAGIGFSLAIVFLSFWLDEAVKEWRRERRRKKEAEK